MNVVYMCSCVTGVILDGNPLLWLIHVADASYTVYPCRGCINVIPSFLWLVTFSNSSTHFPKLPVCMSFQLRMQVKAAVVIW